MGKGRGAGARLSSQSINLSEGQVVQPLDTLQLVPCIALEHLLHPSGNQTHVLSPVTRTQHTGTTRQQYLATTFVPNGALTKVSAVCLYDTTPLSIFDLQGLFLG